AHGLGRRCQCRIDHDDAVTHGGLLPWLAPPRANGQQPPPALSSLDRRRRLGPERRRGICRWSDLRARRPRGVRGAPPHALGQAEAEPSCSTYWSIRSRNRSSASRNCTPIPGTVPCCSASSDVTRCMTSPLVVAGFPPSGSSSCTVITSSIWGGELVWMNTPPRLMFRVCSRTNSRAVRKRTVNWV